TISSSECGDITVGKPNITVGGPAVSFYVQPFISNQEFCTNSFGNTCVVNPDNISNVTGFEWGYSSAENNISPTVVNSSGNYSQDFIFSVAGNYQIYARAKNSCGLGTTETLDIYVSDICVKTKKNEIKENRI